MADCKSLYDHCRNGEIEEVRRALERGEDANKKLGRKKGGTALHIAARKGHRELVALLLDQPKIDPSVTDDAGWTALHLAAYEGHKEVLASLLNHPGVDVNVANTTGREATSIGTTALHIAAARGHLDVLTLLINHPGINLHAGNIDGLEALHYAADQGHVDVVALLLSLEGIDLNATSHQGWTALHSAARFNHEDVATLLMNQPGVDVRPTTNEGNNALHLACVGNCGPHLLRCLLTSPNTDPNVKNRHGRTPIMVLLRNLNLDSELQTLCLQAMVEFNSVDLEIKDASGRGLEDLAR